MAARPVLAGHSLDLTVNVVRLFHKIEVGGFGALCIDGGLTHNVIGDVFETAPQIRVADPADAFGERFTSIKRRSGNAPHSDQILAIGGVAFGDPNADEGASLQPELVVELIDDILEIIVRANRLGDHFVETGPGYLKTEHLVRQASDVLGKGLDLGALHHRAAAMTAQFPDAASRHLLQHDRRMSGDDNDAVAIDEEVRNGADKRRKKWRMEMGFGLVHEHQCALLHALDELRDSEKNDLVARAQPAE
jgi:hypothetical protein